MRVWDLHPGYLSQKNLLGEHAEIHALYVIISEQKKGYSRHPETLRWINHLNQLVIRHNLVAKEMILRGFKHSSPLDFPEIPVLHHYPVQTTFVDLPSLQFEQLMKKYSERKEFGRIPLPIRGTDFWSHHKYSVMARGYQYYKAVQEFMKNRKDSLVQIDNDLIFKIYKLISLPVQERALKNTIQHLWGYLNDRVTQKEKKDFFDLLDQIEQMKLIFEFAVKYQEKYLICSTIFADFLDS